MTDPHGIFAEAFASWRRVIASGTDLEARLTLFEHAALDVAGYTAKGLAKPDAADELQSIASAFGLIEARGDDEIQGVIARAFEHREQEQKKPNGNGAHGPGSSLPNATPYVFPMTIPKRDFLFGGHYVRGTVTATVAPGGGGKTTLVLYELLSMAAQGRRVWYISGEDPRDEIDRRIAAHCQHHHVNQQDIVGRLFVDDKKSFPFIIGRAGRGVAFEEAWLAKLEEQIITNHIDVVALDPFISFHSVSEGDNGAIDQIIKRLAIIAQATNCVIELSHHVRKSPQGLQGDLTVDDSRGGSAIINAVRSARVFNRMSANEAALGKVSADQRAFYVRLDKGKRNMAPPEKASWYRLVSVHLSNGDNVQAIEPYDFPTAFEGMGAADVVWVQTFLRDGGPRRASSQSEDWLGHHIGLHCNREDTREKAGAIWANKIIGQWLANKVFKKVHMRDFESRKSNIAFYADSQFVVPKEDAKGNVLPFPGAEEE